MNIGRYLNLVTSEHQGKPKFTAMLSASLTLVDGATALTDNFVSYFDVVSAIGRQLDILGEIVGVKRVVTFQPTDGSSPVLNDDLYRLIIQAKILKNQWDGTTNQMYDVWNVLFPQAMLIIQDNQDMTMTALIIGLSSPMQKDLISNGYVIPKPQGVRINYAYSTNPFFAYDLETNEFKGYDEGYWAQYF